MLSEAGIVPHSKTRYKATSMEAAIRKHTGFKPKIVCQAKQIKEIYVCFDKTFKVLRCLLITYTLLYAAMQIL